MFHLLVAWPSLDQYSSRLEQLQDCRFVGYSDGPSHQVNAQTVKRRVTRIKLLAKRQIRPESVLKPATLNHILWY